MSNVYESVPGIINLVVRSLIWVVFAVYIILSLLNKDNAAEYFYQNGVRLSIFVLPFFPYMILINHCVGN